MNNIQIALAATTRIVQAVLRATDEKALLEEACSIIVNVGYRFCWVGEVVHDEQKSVRPLACAGFEDGYLAAIKVSWADSPHGCGPTGVSIRTARPVVISDVVKAAEFSPWLAEASKRGYRSCCGMPLMTEGRPFGNLNIYSEQTDAFGEQAMELLVNLAEVLSFGMMNLRNRRQARETLQQREEQLRQAVWVSKMGIVDHDHLAGTIYFSAEFQQLYGLSPNEKLTLDSWLSRVYPEDRDMIARAVQRAHDPAGDGVYEMEHRVLRPDGSVRWASSRTQTFFEGEGSARRAVRTVGAVADITQRKQAEEALRQAEEKYREIFDHAVVGIFQSTPEGRYISVNQALARMSGYGSPQEMIEAISDMRQQEYVDPARRDEFLRLLEEHGVVRDFECEFYRKDGSRSWSLVNARAVRDSRGKTLYYEGTDQDITDRKRLEAQFEQAQKMEAVGRLAGGVAHDFNNLLSVILGYADLSASLLDPGHPAFDKIAQIRRAAERGATLTRQLLAFSRRQVVHPRILDINKVVSGSSDMLKRMVGEDVAISFKPAKDLWLVKVDPGQIEQILMNLAVNARDAMPRGGRILMETSNIEADEHFVSQHPQMYPGAYVMLTFADTGAGIASDNLPHIFEPFFTTKETGKGTGLGLATVYGIVKQGSGHIWVYSEPERGAIFRICFPKAEGAETVPGRSAPAEIPRGSDTILLVEDEASLRELVATLLEDAGYRVLKAESGPSALALAQATPGRIDLLLTDVIMPGMSGVELCTHMLKMRPGIRLLCMSGYTGEQLSPYGQFESENTFLQKPFSNSALLKKVRSALGA
jgi:two-component system cell cycle sensor histidine kinase/response regulator CckA